MKLFIIGSLISIISLIIDWGRIGPFHEYMFFPLWFGYILAINGVSEILIDKSLLSKLKDRFIILFLLSIPFWWLFEFFNNSVRDWRYIIPGNVGPLEYKFRGSVNFSIVIPAILSTSFVFYNALNKIKNFKTKKMKMKNTTPFIIISLGILSLASISIIPNFTFAFIWLGVFLILDPVNYLLGFPSLTKNVVGGRWNLPLSIGFASLFTGFFWEMWNYYSLPKWVYSVPYVGFYKIFEMPILGYLGYPFFGLEVFSFTSFIMGLIGRATSNKNLLKNILSEV